MRLSPDHWPRDSIPPGFWQPPHDVPGKLMAYWNSNRVSSRRLRGRGRRSLPDVQDKGLHLRRNTSRNGYLNRERTRFCAGRSVDRDGIVANSAPRCLNRRAVRKFGEVNIKFWPVITVLYGYE